MYEITIIRDEHGDNETEIAVTGTCDLSADGLSAEVEFSESEPVPVHELTDAEYEWAVEEILKAARFYG